MPKKAMDAGEVRLTKTQRRLDRRTRSAVSGLARQLIVLAVVSAASRVLSRHKHRARSSRAA